MARIRNRSGAGSLLDNGELAETLKSVQKRYGIGSVAKAQDIAQPARISTGVFTLDFALLGGIPDNRISMIVGQRHSGKTTLGKIIVGRAQRAFPDQTPAILDIEGTFDQTWAAKLGVDTSSLPVVACDSGEMAVDVGDAIVGSLETSLLLVDSIAALTPMKEIEASSEDAFVGLQARLIGNFIRRINSALIRERRRGHSVTVLFLNQYRSAIGKFQSFGEPLSIPGGKALEFCTTVQAAIRNKEIKGKDADSGIDTMSDNEHSFTISKNKLNNGPRTGEFVLVREPRDGLNEGQIDDAETILSYAKKFGYYTGAGQKQTLEFGDYSYNFRKIAEAVDALRDDTDMQWELRNYIIKAQALKLGMPKDFIESIGEL